METDNTDTGLDSITLVVQIVLSVALVVGIIANILAIIVIRRSKHHYSYVPSFLVQSLVIVDLITVIILLFQNGLFGALYSGTALKCNVDYVTRVTVAYASGFINMLMCLERLVAFRAPFHYHRYATVFKAKVAVGIALSVALLISLLPIMGLGRYYRYESSVGVGNSTNTTVTRCNPPGELGSHAGVGDKIFTGIYLTVGAIMLTIIYACNVTVILTLRQLGRRLTMIQATFKVQNDHEVTNISTTSMTTTISETITESKEPEKPRKLSIASAFTTATGNDILEQDAKRKMSQEIRLAVVVAVISVVFTISWVPFYIQRLLKAFDVSQPDWYLLLVVFLLVSNHVVDPFVFVFMKQQSRDALVDLFRKSFCRRKLCPPEDPESVTPAVQNGTRELTPSPQESNCIPPPTPTIITS